MSRGETAELLLTQAVYARAFASSTDTMVVADVQGRIVQANPAWLKLYGYALDEVVGQKMSLIKGSASSAEMYRYMWAQIQDPAQGSWRGEVVNRRRDGGEVAVLLSITPIRAGADDTGPVVGYLGHGIDVTARKQLEDQKRLYEMVVRHDLRAPLAAIQSMLQMVVGGYYGDLSAQQTDKLQRALERAALMQRMIDTSLDMEKLARGHLVLDCSEIDLPQAAAHAVETLQVQAAAKDISVTVEAPEVMAALLTDAVHLGRCMENLVKNAIEAAPRGSAVRVVIAEEGEQVSLRVHNSGDPIPPPVRATLFHPFSTFGKRGGTGLGIYGVKMAMEALGGSVSYVSDAEETVFTLSLPRAGAPCRAE